MSGALILTSWTAIPAQSATAPQAPAAAKEHTTAPNTKSASKSQSATITAMTRGANPRYWRVLVPKRKSGKRSLTRITGTSTLTRTMPSGQAVTDAIRVRTGKSFVRRAVSVERRRLDEQTRWIESDRGLTSKRGRFNADLMPGGLGTWEFRFKALKEPGAVAMRAPGETLLSISQHTSTQISWDQISAGGSHTCALSTTRTPYCWGYGGTGALGNGGLGGSLIPAPVTTRGVLDGVDLSQIVTGSSHTCALDNDGLAYCWGRGLSGELGSGTMANSSVPVRVDTSGVLRGVTLTALSAGNDRTCAVSETGDMYCWGEGKSGALGNGAKLDQSVPVKVKAPAGPRPFIEISTGGTHTCAVREGGAASCWGKGSSGQLGAGDGTYASTSEPERVAIEGEVKSISSGGSSSCAVLTLSTQSYCWGSADDGRLGNGQPTNTDTPSVTVDLWIDGAVLSQISSSEAYSCALTTSGQVACWGLNRNGQLGLGHLDNGPWPQLTPSSEIRDLSTGARHACAVNSNGEGFCWGNGANGELGNGNGGTSYSPWPVSQPLN